MGGSIFIPKNQNFQKVRINPPQGGGIHIYPKKSERPISGFSTGINENPENRINPFILTPLLIMMETYRDVHDSGRQFQTYQRRIDFSSMSEYQKNKIKEFILDLRIGKAGKKVKDRRIVNYLQFLLKLHSYLKKDLDKISEKEATQFYLDLQDDRIRKDNQMPYAQASKDEFIKTLKRYLGWCWGKSSLKYRRAISWMKEDYKKSEKKAITLKDANKAIKEEPSLRNQCLFMFLFDSGARIEEALNVRILDLEISTNSKHKYFKVHLRGQKTEEADRIIPVPITQTLLSKWLKKHPTRKDEDYLFPIRYDNARKIIKQMSERALNAPLRPHELRHSSATHYIQYGGFGAENIGGFYYRYGWKFGSKEALTYIKTYLYSGDLGQDKVVGAIESNRVEILGSELEDLKEKLTSIINGKDFMTLLTGLVKQQQEMSKTLERISGQKFDFILSGINK